MSVSTRSRRLRKIGDRRQMSNDARPTATKVTKAEVTQIDPDAPSSRGGKEETALEPHARATENAQPGWRDVAPECGRRPATRSVSSIMRLHLPSASSSRACRVFGPLRRNDYGTIGHAVATADQGDQAFGGAPDTDVVVHGNVDQLVEGGVLATSARGADDGHGCAFGSCGVVRTLDRGMWWCEVFTIHIETTPIHRKKSGLAVDAVSCGTRTEYEADASRASSIGCLLNRERG